MVVTATPKVVGNTYAAVAADPKPITKSDAVNTELTWYSDDAKYRKLSDIAKTKKPKKQTNKKHVNKVAKKTERQKSNSEHRIAKCVLGLKKSFKWVEY